MIPLILIQSSLEFATEALKAFNSLSPQQREQIVKRLLEDDAARRKWWEEVQAWFGGQVGKIKL